MTEKTRFIHSVYFWLNPGGSTEDAISIIDGCRTYLAAVPGVLRLEVGMPAGTQRDVVDNSYGVALIVEFADAASHDSYQEHPLHLEFIRVCSSKWNRVQVYDLLIAA